MDWFSTLLAPSSEDASSLEARLTQFEGGLARLREVVEQAILLTQPAVAGDLRAHPDLAELLAEALQQVEGDVRRVWYRPACGFRSTIVCQDAVILGGLHSRAFLWPEPALHASQRAHWPVLPLIWQAHGARILLIPSLQGTVSDWVPFLEEVARAGQPLIAVTTGISTELLKTLILNDLRGALACAAIRPGEEVAPLLEASASQVPAARLVKSLPVASVHARRAASLLSWEAEAPPGFSVKTCAWIEVSGANYQDQQLRLRVMAAAVARREADLIREVEHA